MTLDALIEKYESQKKKLEGDNKWDLMYAGRASVRYSIIKEIIEDLESLKKEGL